MTHDFQHITCKRKAAPIICTWCPELINTGEMYVTWAQVFDGSIGRMNMHPECERAYYQSTGLDDFSPSDMERGEAWA